MRLSALTGVAGVLGALTGAYFKFARPGVLNWGATPEEIARVMPGDEVLPSVALQTTRVITIDAAPEAIWPWLVQMGPRPRAGVYTYDWLERLLGIDIKNSDRILPEFQHLEAGTFWELNKKGQGLRVLEVQAERCLVLQWEPAKSTWAFILYPQSDGRTRLVSRNRIPGSGPLFWLTMVAFVEAGSLVMERKMLMGIRSRAEVLAHDRTAAVA
ncbi:MAG TPA: SRPBCC family protein [Dehalococcoidia bacterium]|nr:SRPBCC family protein [Dehalococcoidia bacterium]